MLCVILWGCLVFVSVHDVVLTMRHNELVRDFNDRCAVKLAYVDAIEVGVIDEGFYNKTV